MIYLIFSIISSTSIFVFFKLFEKYKVKTINGIIINYIVASVLGFLIFDAPLNIKIIYQQAWFELSIVIGVLFILMFFVISLSTKKVGISITTVASKMAFIIPILISLFYFNENITNFKISGIVIALVAVFLTVMKKRTNNFRISDILIPIVLFIGMGLVDAVVLFSQKAYNLQGDSSSLFSAVLFSFAGITGIIIALFKIQLFKEFLNIRVIVLGTLLGIGNFGTIYFLINALNSELFKDSSSVLYGINNIGIVGSSVLIGLLAYKEKLSLINWIGISLAVIAIIVLSYTT